MMKEWEYKRLELKTNMKHLSKVSDNIVQVNEGQNV